MISPRTALVIGSEGQDGRYLSRHLVAEGWRVAGLSRANLTLFDGTMIEGETRLTDPDAVADVIARSGADRIFYLAAHHASSDLRHLEDPLSTFDKSIDTNLLGLANVLKAMVKAGRGQRVCYAASSHIFGAPDHQPQTELTVMRPASAYAVSKAAAIETCRLFRRQHGVFASVAILYNHESPLRTIDYVTQKVATAAAEISTGRADRLELRNVWAMTDWGAAQDYVRAMAMILDAEQPDDFIVASGQSHSIAAFAAIAFGHVGLDWRDYVVSQAAEPDAPLPPGLVGDPGKLKAVTNWRPELSFSDLVIQMVDAALARQVPR
jgi:GDPmannose 4,6-dehydratase